MRIKSITVRNYRVHRELTVELDASRSLIGGANETGKSTLVEAAHRALFLKSKITGETQKSMISRSHGGHPEVEVCFEVNDSEWRVLKRYSGNTGSTMLSESGGETLHGDEAETRLADLLGVEPTAGGRGAGERSAQQWGHLWVWQGRAGDDPAGHANAQKDSLLARLQDTGGAAVMQSELDAQVQARFAGLCERDFTKGDVPRKGSDLAEAIHLEQKAAASLQEATAVFDDLQQAVKDFEEASRTIESADKDRAGLRVESAEVEKKLVSVAELSGKQETQKVVADNASKDLGEFEESHEQINRVQSDINALSSELRPKDAETEQLTAARDKCKGLHADAEHKYQAAIDAASAERRVRDLALAHVRLLEKTVERDQLRERLKRMEKSKDRVKKLEMQLAKLPAVTPKRLKSLEKLEKTCSNAESALKAMAAGVEVISSTQSVRVGGEPIKVGQSRTLTEAAEIAVGRSARLRITPGGGGSLKKARADSRDARHKLEDQLASTGVATVVAATETLTRRQQLEKDMGALEAGIQGLGGDALDQEMVQVEADWSAAGLEVSSRARGVKDFSAPTSLQDARARASDAGDAVSAAEAKEKAAKEIRDAATTNSATASKALTDHMDGIQDAKTKLGVLETQLKILLETHGKEEDRAAKLDGLREQNSKASDALEKTEAGLQALQPDLLQKDKVRIDRALNECDSTRNKAVVKQGIAQNTLQSDGTVDPQADLIAAEAGLRQANDQRDIVERRARAVQLLDRLFTEEQQALADALSRPLAEKVTGYLQCLFGAGARANVRLKDNEFVGLELVRPDQDHGACAFDDLSGGAREQVAAAVRLAMAEVLADGDDKCLPMVFDDAFAYSDPERVQTLQRMLDLGASRGLQIIVLTCNPSDYAGLGARQITLTSQQLSSNPSHAPSGAGDVAAISDTPAENGGEEASPDTAGLSVTEDHRRKFLEALRAEGGARGNVRLRRTLGWDEPIYTATKDDLIASGSIMPGRGRGGSVTLPS